MVDKSVRFLPQALWLSLPRRWPPVPHGSPRGDLWLARLVVQSCARVMVETGVEEGHSSTILLAASKNWNGRLFSIDLPHTRGEVNADGAFDGAHVSRREDTGRFIPRRYRSRWELTLADARQALGPLLERVGSIDLFYHDSEHSFDHMTFEYRLAWQYLRRGGVLASDDIRWNSAWGSEGPFEAFAREVGRPIFYSPGKGRGAVIR